MRKRRRKGRRKRKRKRRKRKIKRKRERPRKKLYTVTTGVRECRLCIIEGTLKDGTEHTFTFLVH